MGNIYSTWFILFITGLEIVIITLEMTTVEINILITRNDKQKNDIPHKTKHNG